MLAPCTAFACATYYVFTVQYAAALTSEESMLTKLKRRWNCRMSGFSSVACGAAASEDSTRHLVIA